MKMNHSSRTEERRELDILGTISSDNTEGRSCLKHLRRTDAIVTLTRFLGSLLTMITTLLRRGSSCTRAISTFPALHVNPPDPATESAEFDARLARLADYFSRPRFANISRPYSPRDVALKQGCAPVLPLPASLLADKLFRIFEHASANGIPVHTMGAIDPIQMTQMASHQQVVYVSGWAASSLLTTGSNEVGPDFGYVPLFAPSQSHSHHPETIHTPQFQTRYNVYSAPSNSTTRNITTNACPLHRTHA